MLRENMNQIVLTALHNFTQRYIDLWQQETGHPPVNKDLHGISSPCIVKTVQDQVYWLPQRFTPVATLERIEYTMKIQLHDDIHTFYTQQYAGDMMAELDDQHFTLLQVWSEDDFIRLQENLIGHLVTQKRLKLSPTLFLATTDSDINLISFCNVSGNVILEQFGSNKRSLLAPTLSHFLNIIHPVWQR